ncbi:hypothetical protein BD560DRAFT_362804 [Blakeslea trispora]|nr:hypothetical protein BD560DRAFT_362804 [Blakeslea trispora]
MYVNWNEVIVEGFEWYPVDVVLKHLHKLRRFIIRTTSAFSPSYLPKLVEYELPASKNKRFPENQRYLCEAIGKWNKMKDELEMAASVMVCNNRLDRGYPHYKTQGDAEQYALDLIQSLLDIIESKKDTLTRREFEERYGLNWKEENSS